MYMLNALRMGDSYGEDPTTNKRRPHERIHFFYFLIVQKILYNVVHKTDWSESLYNIVHDFHVYVVTDHTVIVHVSLCI